MSTATIAAISTPLGTGGIGIVRVSGPASFDVAGRVFRSNSGILPKDMKGFTSCLGRIMDEETALDDAICQIYRAPKSYTGENVVELSCHGGVWTLQKILRLCLENGAEAAGPGEFTKRAFVNGKLNLTQAEAVMDMIHAQGQSAMKAAISARDGAISNQVSKVANDLLGQSAHLAAWADFPDEDLEKLDLGAVSGTLHGSVNTLNKLLASYDAGKILREGISAAIVGKPNVGKSTLMNLLSGSQRSIVTDIPGTTRDVVEDTVLLGDFVLRLADTAGIRETDDPVEIEGVERSRLQMRTAELVFAVFDSSDALTSEDRALLEQLEDMPCIAVINKIDLPPKLDLSAIESKIPYTVTISAKSGTGLGELESAAVKLLGLSSFDASAGIIANERQRLCVIQARDSLVEAESALANAMLDAVNVCIDFALDALFTLTGERASDKVVDEVFARFCVGK